MVHRLSRRTFVRCGSLAGAACVWPDWDARAAVSGQGGPTPPAASVGDQFPSHPPDLVREVVTTAHGNFEKLKERVEAQPALARATWDWGFGDFESALDGASHVGNRPIAEYLIGKGARPTPFTAAMLGNLDVVRALVIAMPGIQRARGPHGITMMAHAKAGGAQAAPVVAYLESLGDADPKFPTVPLTDANIAALAGAYAFGPGPRDRFDVGAERGQLGILRPGGTRRGLFHLGSMAFFPTGAEAVRVRFQVVEGRATSLTIHDPDVLMHARRV